MHHSLQVSLGRTATKPHSTSPGMKLALESKQEGAQKKRAMVRKAVLVLDVY